MKMIDNRDILSTNLEFVAGLDTDENPIVTDLETMQNLLIGGMLGTGKTEFIESLLLTFIQRNDPDDVGVLVIDTDRSGFDKFNEVPHLLGDVATDPKSGINTLRRIVKEMENRFAQIATMGAEDFSEYNDKIAKGAGNDDEKRLGKMKQIVVIIAELEGLMRNYREEAEPLIISLAQLGNIAGIYPIVASKYLSYEIITRLIWACISTKIAFQVKNRYQSEMLLNRDGAEKLSGKGAMLLRLPEQLDLIKARAIQVTEEEINDAIDFVKSKYKK